MKPLTKTTVKWIIGLVIAVLAAVSAYISTGCSFTHTNKVTVDSLNVRHLDYNSGYSGDIKK
jgi:hypothetical protein